MSGARLAFEKSEGLNSACIPSCSIETIVRNLLAYEQPQYIEAVAALTVMTSVKQSKPMMEAVLRIRVGTDEGQGCCLSSRARPVARLETATRGTMKQRLARRGTNRTAAQRGKWSQR